MLSATPHTPVTSWTFFEGISSDLYICEVGCGVDLGSELEGHGELMQERLVLLEVDGRQMVDGLGKKP